jgi:hypothetical protein
MEILTSESIYLLLIFCSFFRAGKFLKPTYWLSILVPSNLRQGITNGGTIQHGIISLAGFAGLANPGE